MEFITPGKIIYGDNALTNSADSIACFGKKAFVVAGRHLLKSGEIKRLTDILENKNIDYIIYDNITGEPTDLMINEGVRLYKENKCDFLIGIGGGSPIDSMKAIALLSENGGKCSDYMGGVPECKLPPMVAVPTTAGTGSEATVSTIITDTDTRTKMLIKGAALMPDVSIIDAIFTYSCPANVTAATGLDALTHAIEAYTSRRAGMLTDIAAESAVKRIFKYLPKAYRDGSNEIARKEMAIAALEAGIAICNSSVTIVHGMSRPIGALFHVPHGLSNAMLLPTCLKFAVSGAYDKFAELGRAVGITGLNDIETANRFIEEVEIICKICEVVTPAEYGIDRHEFEINIEKMADDALASGSPYNTMRVPDKKEIMELYGQLW